MKKNYTQPAIEVIELQVERGFDVSGATLQTLSEDEDYGLQFN